MASKVEIVNRALTRLGQQRITSLSDNTGIAKAVNAVFDDLAEDVMSMGPWPSCVTRATLAQLVAAPEYEYTYQYQLPTSPKLLRILNVNDAKPGAVDYRIEGDKLLTDENSIKIKYIGSISDTESYDVYLKQAIIAALEAELAYFSTGNKAGAESLRKGAEAKIMDLLSSASMMGSNDDLPSDDYIDVRDDS